MKNLCGKMKTVNEPYEIYRNCDGFEWRVLKKYQTPEKEAANPYARWMVACKSPMTGGTYDMGDTYVRDIADMGGRLVWSSAQAPLTDAEKW